MADKIIVRKASLVLGETDLTGGKEIVFGIPVLGTEKALVREFNNKNEVHLMYLYNRNADGRSSVRFIEPEQEAIVLNTALNQLTASVGKHSYYMDVKNGYLSFKTQWIALRGEDFAKPNRPPLLSFMCDFSSERNFHG